MLIVGAQTAKRIVGYHHVSARRHREPSQQPANARARWGQRGVSVVNGSMNVSITGWSDKCLNVHQLRGARASGGGGNGGDAVSAVVEWMLTVLSACGVGRRFPRVFSSRACCCDGGDNGADLGPLYLCSVTDVRRSSLHSVLRPGSAWQQISAGCSPRHPTEGGCVARARRRQVLIVAVLDRPSTHKADVSHRRECGRKAGLMRASSCQALGTLHYPKPHER